MKIIISLIFETNQKLTGLKKTKNQKTNESQLLSGFNDEYHHMTIIFNQNHKAFLFNSRILAFSAADKI